MDTYDFEINNFEEILQSREKEDLVLQRLSGFIAESHAKVKTLINKFIENQKKRQNIVKENDEIQSEWRQESRDLDHKLEQTVLQQKVFDRKISNYNKSIEQLREVIELEKTKKEQLTLELMEVEAEHEAAKVEKIKEYSALKKAIGVYKDKLNIHVAVEVLNDHDRIKLTFFVSENPNKDYYYVEFLNYNNIVWKVESIVPELNEEHVRDLNLNFSRDYEVQDIMKLIPKLRSIFIKHCMSP